MQFRLGKINEIKYYFIAKRFERETMSKNLSKNIAAFDNFDIALFATVVGAPVGIVIARVGLDFFVSNQIKKKFFKAEGKTQKVLLVKSKLQSYKVTKTSK